MSDNATSENNTFPPQSNMPAEEKEEEFITRLRNRPVPGRLEEEILEQLNCISYSPGESSVRRILMYAAEQIHFRR